MGFKTFFLRGLLKMPVLNRYGGKWYSKLGVQKAKSSRIAPDITLKGAYSNLVLDENSEINTGCFLLLRDRLSIGENSTLAYQVTILTSANPNGPKNLLSKKYKKYQAPVTIGRNSWIGARATILPGVKIGDFCIVAAGAIVNQDVPDYSVVAGIPAKIVKKLDPKDFE